MLVKSQIGGAASQTVLAVALMFATQAATAQSGKTLLVAEPVHSVGYLPVYAAIRNGYFAEDGLDVKILTVESAAGHTNAVLSRQAFAFVGGPEHNAFAKLKGAELRSVVNCVDRGNIYFMAKKGMGPKPEQDLAAYMKGKNIATGPYSGSPNSITRLMLKKWNLDPKADVTLHEMANSVIIAAVKGGRAEIGVSTEPFITRGLKENIWDGPFVNIPQDLGPYAYSTLNVRLESIKSDPDTMRKFVRGVMRGLKFTNEKPEEATKAAKQEFPTMAEADLKATLDRSFADQMWSKDGLISEQSWKTNESVVLAAGVLKQSVPYSEIIDMQFVNALMPTMK